MPTRDRPERLRTCLTALRELDYPQQLLEVVVVDDSGDGSISRVVAPFQQDLTVNLVVQPPAGPAAARNRGVTHASGECVAFTDDDCEPASDWLRRLADGLAASPSAAVGGHTLNALTENVQSTASQLLIDYIYSYYNANPAGAKFFTSNNFALRANDFREVGGFDTRFPLAAAEDRDFCDRWLASGRSLRYVPDAIVRHSHSLTLRSFARQHFNYGRGALQFHTSRAARNRAPVKREPLTFYLNLLKAPWKQPNRSVRLSALLFLSQFANAAGYYYAKHLGRQQGVHPAQTAGT